MYLTWRRVWSLPLGLALACLCLLASVSTPGRGFERMLAHGWLYASRGSRTPPEGVLIVSIDPQALGFVGRKPQAWDQQRRRFAQLIKRLHECGADAIVMDVAFDVLNRPTGDRQLTQAIRDSNRVVLFSRLERTDTGDQIAGPIPPLASASRATAVFALPKVPARVDHYWPWLTARGPENPVQEYLARAVPESDAQALAANHQPSLPVAALQVQVVARLGVQRINRLVFEALRPAPTPPSIVIPKTGPLTQSMIALRQRLEPSEADKNRWRVHVDRQAQLNDRQRALLHAWFNSYTDAGARLLNYYGPAHTLRTVDMNRFLAMSEGQPWHALCQARVVFVGHSSTRAVDQQDGFMTVYSDASGIDMSGVEIAATAYANLIDDSTLTRAGALASMVALGILATLSVLLAFGTGPLLSMAGMLGLAVGYYLFAHHAFVQTHTLFPVALPLLVLLPPILLAGQCYQFLRTRRQRDHYLQGASLLLPRGAISAVRRNVVGQQTPVGVDGICLISDIENYTQLSEITSPEVLAAMSSEYFASVGSVIRKYDGEVIDLEGDSLTAVWIDGDAANPIGSNACLAALEIIDLIALPGSPSTSPVLRTRVGLNAGHLAVGTLGGGVAYRYRYVGDVMNTTARLEALNKTLGTNILASAPVVARTMGIQHRFVGRFLLKGKATPVQVFEIVDSKGGGRLPSGQPEQRFSEAIANLDGTAGNRQQVLETLSTLDDTRGLQALLSFYIDLLAGQAPGGMRLNEQGVIVMPNK